MKTPADKHIAFTYVSHPTKTISWRWTATLDFPAGADETTVLTLTLVNGEREPVREGTFEFAGKMIPVKDGKASLAYADFIAGKHASAIWLHRPDIEPIPGSLTFA